MYFDQYDLDAFWDQFLGPSINNDHPKCTYLHHVRFVHMGEYLDFKKMILKIQKSNLNMLTMTYIKCPIKYIGG